MPLAVDIVGTIPGWLTLVFLAGSALYVMRHGGSTAIEELSKANDYLGKRVQSLGGEVRDLKVQNAELRGRTDIAAVLSPLIDWTAHHEARAQERHEATLKLLALIAERFGPDEDAKAA